MSQTTSRKEEHVRLCIEENVRHRLKSNGFERWEFEHNALPEIDLSQVDSSRDFLSKHLSFPLMITGMTGGYEGATEINRQLAEVCESLHLAMGVGSQRQAIESTEYHESYRVARRNAPSIPLVANIGAAQLRSYADPTQVHRIIELIDADAIAVHLNPLQELLQPEGDPHFSGVLSAIERLASSVEIPVIVKEVGAGISARVARRLADVGVRWIDVSGAGGTSWAGVEMLRRDSTMISDEFWDWGIPTADALIETVNAVDADVKLIASGGIEDGVMIAKAIALGAHIAGAARPLLLALNEGGQKRLLTLLEGWRNDLRGTMFLTGCRTLDELRAQTLRQRAV